MTTRFRREAAAAFSEFAASRISAKEWVVLVLVVLAILCLIGLSIVLILTYLFVIGTGLGLFFGAIAKVAVWVFHLSL